MLEYLPWSQKTLSESLAAYEHGLFTLLDVEVGGSCNLSCVYCDSPNRTVKSTITIESFTKLLADGNVSWVFICGLGEPTARANVKQFQALINSSKIHGARVSAFTNATAINDRLAADVCNGDLCLLFKCDTFDPDKIRRLYGAKNADSVISGIARALSLVSVSNDLTNIAASIVPTTENFDDIISIVKSCLDRGVFPMIGDLEDSGKGKDTYSRLKLSAEKLVELKKNLSKTLGVEYSVPICPATIAGIHVGYDFTIFVDELSGLSCHWFWLEQPRPISLGHLDQFEEYSDICRKIIAYRSARLDAVEVAVANLAPLPIGGCGGDIVSMIRFYLAAHKKASRAIGQT